MLDLLFSAAMTCLGSLILGQAVLALCGARRWSWLAPAVGVAVMILLAVPAIHLPGRSATVAVATAVAILAHSVPDLSTPTSATTGGRPGCSSGRLARVCSLCGVRSRWDAGSLVRQRHGEGICYWQKLIGPMRLRRSHRYYLSIRLVLMRLPPLSQRVSGFASTWRSPVSLPATRFYCLDRAA